MEEYALFTLLWTNIAIPVNGAGAAIIAALMTKIGPWFQLCVGAYLVCMMLVASWSSDTGAVDRLFRQLFLAGIIYTIISTIATFDYYVSGLYHGIVNGISTAVAAALNKGNNINANAYDIIGMRAYSLGLAVLKNLPFSLRGAVLGILVIIYWFLSYGAVVVMFAVYLVSYVAGSFLVDFGVVFIACYFFPFTRRLFDGWLSVLLSAVVVQIFTAGLGSLFVFTLGLILNLSATGMDGSQAGQVDGGIVVGQLLILVGAALICCIFGVLAGVIVYMAVRITGGAHAELGRMSTPGWVSSVFNSAERHTSHNSSGDGHHQPANSNSPSPVGGSNNQTQRQYAFNRNVGGAP